LILEHLVELSGLPVSCKIRLLEDKEKSKEFIESIQTTGIKFFTIHLRKKDQPSSFKANWKALYDIVFYF
jgi:tRNA-dihydrouridine synthase 2